MQLSAYLVYKNNSVMESVTGQESGNYHKTCATTNKSYNSLFSMKTGLTNLTGSVLEYPAIHQKIGMLKTVLLINIAIYMRYFVNLNVLPGYFSLFC